MTATLNEATQPVRVSPGAARATLAALQARWGYRPCDDSATPEVVTIRSMVVSTWRRISGRGQSARHVHAARRGRRLSARGGLASHRRGRGRLLGHAEQATGGPSPDAAKAPLGAGRAGGAVMTGLVYGSVCSGIEAATVAWHPLGWRPAWFAEIDTFPSAVLAHRFPEVPNHGDFTGITAAGAGIDLLVGGTPCQSFSVAGNRLGLEDDRGNLALQFCRLAGRLLPRWVIWENVAGALSTDGGRAFGSIVGALADLGYGWAYRVLDAGFFGSPHRRRRVFLVGHLGDWRDSAAVLFDGEGCFRNPPKSGASRYSACYSPEERARIFVEGKEGLPYLTASNAAKGINNQTPIIFHPTQDPINHVGHSINVDATMISPGVLKDGVLRRFTPLEVERLFGFPDHYTAIPGAKDAPRYKALGNSMAVPVMRWIGERIQSCDAMRRAA